MTAQVKEKYFGFTLIRKAEEESAKTCEKCGKPGELDNSRHWLLTLCEDCKSQRT